MNDDRSKTGALGWERIMVLIGEVKSSEERYKALHDRLTEAGKKREAKRFETLLIELLDEADKQIKKQQELINALLQREGERGQLL